MKLQTRLTAAFASLAVATLLVSALAVGVISRDEEDFAKYVNGIDARATMAAKVRQAVDARAVAARNLVLVNNPADVAAEKAAVEHAHAEVGRNLAELKRLIAAATDANQQAHALVAEMDRIESAYSPVALGIVELALKGQKDEAIAKMNNECRPLLAALVKTSEEYAQVAVQSSQAVILETRASSTLERNVLIVICLLTLVATAITGLKVTRSITRPMAEAMLVAQRVADGDLTSRVVGSGNDEVAQLLEAIGRMSRNLQGIVGQVRNCSDSIATGSSQIASGNADLSRRTEQQASSLEETAASMEQLSTTVKQNSESARHANQLAASASLVAVQGGDTVNRVVATMRSINDASKQIEDIIGVIDGIAFQTNILALNAAVEAARAGEQGRGFAVVASEVRSLAQRSAAAAREIKALIATSVERVEQGSSLVDQAGATMTEIVSSIKRVEAIIGEITDASIEQSSGVSQVGEAVSQMDQITQQNAALVEQSAAAAESLNQQALQLVQAVSVFRLSEHAQA
jgi:methyl-accepting chemotaxis protein-1 (serine sensor receptor)